MWQASANLYQSPCRGVRGNDEHQHPSPEPHKLTTERTAASPTIPGAPTSSALAWLLPDGYPGSQHELSTTKSRRRLHRELPNRAISKQR